MATTRKRRIKHAKIVEVFAERLRAIRASRSMTQRDLAQRANVTVSYVSKLEAGGAAPGIDLLERLASALNVTLPELLPVPAEGSRSDQEQARLLFDSLLTNAGQETLLLLKLFLARLAESPALGR